MQRVKALIAESGWWTKSVFLAIGTFGMADFISYQYYDKRRRELTRITESMADKKGGQYEVLKSNLGVLITPSLDNMHSFEQYKNMEDEYATESNFRDILDSVIPWNAETLSFKNIPENQMVTFSNYWDTFRREAFVIKEKYHIYRLHADQWDHHQNSDDNEMIGKLLIRDLVIDDLNEICRLNEGTLDRFVMARIIESEQISIGVFDEKQKLVAFCFMNIDDLSASDVVMDNDSKYVELKNEIKERLSRLMVDRHFERGYNRLNSNVDVEDEGMMKMREEMGFEKLPQVYYWIHSLRKIEDNQ